MSEREGTAVQGDESPELTCPHCHKSFVREPLLQPTARHRGYKCPHCRLFVPRERAVDAPLARDREP